MSRAFVIGLVLTASCVPRAEEAKATLVDALLATRTVHISATRLGFEPDRIHVRTGETVRFAFTRRAEDTCLTSVVIWSGDHRLGEQALPLGVTVEVTLRFETAGEIGMSCPMKMFGLTVHVD